MAASLVAAEECIKKFVDENILPKPPPGRNFFGVAPRLLGLRPLRRDLLGSRHPRLPRRGGGGRRAGGEEERAREGADGRLPHLPSSPPLIGAGSGCGRALLTARHEVGLRQFLAQKGGSVKICCGATIGVTSHRWKGACGGREKIIFAAAATCAPWVVRYCRTAKGCLTATPRSRPIRRHVRARLGDGVGYLGNEGLVVLERDERGNGVGVALREACASARRYISATV